jgi:hypothetical protein
LCGREAHDTLATVQWDDLNRVNNATTQDELLEIMNNVRVGSQAWERAKEKMEVIRHAETRPARWYRQPATWIAFIGWLLALLSWLFPRH